MSPLRNARVNSQIQQSVGRLIREEDPWDFWVGQILGWAALSIISYFSLNLWYNQPDLAYLGHNILQSILGIAVSAPLRTIYRHIWLYGFVARLFVISASVLIFATVWAALRLLLFQYMTGEQGLWADFGGWLFTSIFVFLCWTAMYHVFKYYRLAEMEHTALLRMESLRNSEAAKAARAESSAREAQLTMLRYQLNPHFLFNTLNAIQSLVGTRRTERATAMIASLSDFLRYSLYTDGKKLVTVGEELEAIELYLQIEQARFQDRLRVEYDVEPGVAKELIPSMLLQPLVENAIKYAVAPSETGGSVTITARHEGQFLELAVIDSGRAGHADFDGESTGVGLSNIQQRLENTYGSDFAFQLSAQDSGGMRAEIRIPLFAAVSTG